MQTYDLEPEQEALLVELVEAHRNTPRPQRGPFMAFRVLSTRGLPVRHPGLPEDFEVYEGDLRDLESLFLIRFVGYGNAVQFEVTREGFRYYEELKARSGATVQTMEQTVQSHLSSDTFQRHYPQAHLKWEEAAGLLWSTDSERQLTTIGHLCREAMQEFADALATRRGIPSAEQKNKDVARIKAVIGQEKDRLGTRVSSFLDALLAYWGTVSDLTQRQEHGNQKEGRPLVWEDARRTVFHTAVVMFEVDRAFQVGGT